MTQRIQGVPDAETMNWLHRIAIKINPHALFSTRERMAAAALDAMGSLQNPSAPERAPTNSPDEIHVSEGMIEAGKLAWDYREAWYVYLSIYRAMEKKRREEQKTV